MADSVTTIVALVILFFLIRFLFGGGDPAPANGSGAARGNGAQRAARSQPRRLHPVSPAQVDTVLSMFPHFPRNVIEADLAATGSVEATCDNILSGALVPPPQPISSSSSKTGPTTNPLKNFIKDDSVPMPSVHEKVWEPTREGRESNLRARKEQMVRMAREKLKKAKAEPAVVAGSAAKTD
ncbi:hypothetical protein HDU67_002409 [Dinochytrium kinnereticum]|nr:hypothetical protein HDU67_002409 [Dinochytrium kinnereticum]